MYCNNGGFCTDKLSFCTAALTVAAGEEQQSRMIFISKLPHLPLKLQHCDRFLFLDVFSADNTSVKMPESILLLLKENIYSKAVDFKSLGEGLSSKLLKYLVIVLISLKLA